jgi:asparagine synthase (glutamine-hydrolysing)
LRVQGGKKALLRAAARRLLPATLVDRPKRGFNPPIGLWLKGELSGLVGERLTDSALARLQIDPVPVRRLLEEFRRGRRDVGLKVWALLMAVCWVEAQAHR